MSRWQVVCGVLVSAGVVSWSEGGEDRCAVPSSGADMVVVRINDGFKWGTVGDITAYSFGTELLNVGDDVLAWDAQAASHPVMIQNLYRLEAGRLEQIGLSWVKHTFRAVPQGPDCLCVDPGDDQLLGVGCTDPYAATTNGEQAGFNGGQIGGMGPRSEVNAATGVFPWPFTTRGQAGSAIYKRLQVLNGDVDPSRHPGARYFVDSHYVSAEEPQANRLNNASYREVLVGEWSEGGYELESTGDTVESPAVVAWQDANSDVQLTTLEIADDGTVMIAYLVTPNDDGTWHYEYVVYNMTSDRSIASFDVPISDDVTLTNIGFHDVHHHSGDGFDSTDWVAERSATAMSWAAENAAADPAANAIRWGTAYTFRFDADAPPAPVTATLGLFKSGPSMTTAATICGPDATAGMETACVEQDTDDDADGVSDDDDVCPQTPSGATVDATGCSMDQLADRQPPSSGLCGASSGALAALTMALMLVAHKNGRRGRRLSRRTTPSVPRSGALG